MKKRVIPGSLVSLFYFQVRARCGLNFYASGAMITSSQHVGLSDFGLPTGYQYDFVGHINPFI